MLGKKKSFNSALFSKVFGYVESRQHVGGLETDPHMCLLSVWGQLAIPESLPLKKQKQVSLLVESSLSPELFFCCFYNKDSS